METRMFSRTIAVRSSNGIRSETFNRGERVKYIRRFGKAVMFEPVDPHHIAGTYTMEWDEFLTSTDLVREANA
jgi:hypothetical protein